MGLCLFMISMCTRPNMFLSFSWKMSEFHWLCIVSCYYVEWNIWQTRHHLKAYIVVYFRFPSTHYFCLFFSVCHFTQTHIDVMQNFDSRDTINCIPNGDRKSTRLNSSHANISYAVFCLKKKKKKKQTEKKQKKQNKKKQTKL